MVLGFITQRDKIWEDKIWVKFWKGQGYDQRVL